MLMKIDERPIVSEGYELESGQVIDGLYPDDVLEGVRIWHAYAPRLLDPGCPSADELDAMARAFVAMREAQQRREDEEREHEGRADTSARELACLLEARRRTHARHVENVRGSRLS